MRFERSLAPFIHYTDPARRTLSEGDTEVFSHGVLMNHPLDMCVEDDLDLQAKGQTPDLIKVRGEIRPIFNHNTVMGTCTHNGQTLTPCALYNDDHVPLSAVDIVFSGYGSAFLREAWTDFTHGITGRPPVQTREGKVKGGDKGEHKLRDQNESESNTLLYRKYFSSLKSGIHLSSRLSTTPPYRGLLFTYEGGEDVHESTEDAFYFPKDDPGHEHAEISPMSRPLWGYGGGFSPHMKVCDIVQYYVSLNPGEGKTCTILYDQGVFQNHRIVLKHNTPVSLPHKGLMHCVSAPPPYMNDSLEEDIVHGRSVIYYKGACYHSLSLEQKGTSRVVYITYARTKDQSLKRDGEVNHDL